MTGCRRRDIVYVGFVILAAVAALGFGVAFGQESRGGAESAMRSQRPWIMVSLSPSGCSKGCLHVLSTVREFSGNPRGTIIPFRELTVELVAEKDPEFIVLSPQGTPWCRYEGIDGVGLQNFLWALPLIAEEMNIPVLGICGGHQALALAFGGKVGPIRAGEHDCLPYSRARQGGVVPLTLTQPDPIFGGVDGNLSITQSHYDEVKVLPPGFVLLASEKDSPVQIMRHAKRPVYGVQGHPESFHPGRPGGALLIRNFIKIARTHNQAVRGFLPQADPRLSSNRK